MRPIPILAVAASATALTPPAHAATTLTAEVRATPGATGTAKRPHGVKLSIGFDLATPVGQDQPTVTAFEVWHGPGLAFDRAKGYATCSPKRLAKLGPGGCPPKSRLGSTTGSADWDDLEPTPKMQIFNGPAGLPLASMTLQRPARVRAVVPAQVVDRPRSAWPHRTLWTVPEIMRVAAGIPVPFNHLQYTYGYTPAAKLAVASTSCPQGGWRWRVRVHTVDAAGVAAVLHQDGRAPCTAARED